MTGTRWIATVTMIGPCTSAPSGDAPPDGAPVGTVSEGAARTAIGAPTTSGKGSLAASPPRDMSPGKAPAQAGTLAGTALPTNQW